jgi:hypothetical protein
MSRKCLKENDFYRNRSLIFDQFVGAFGVMLAGRGIGAMCFVPMVVPSGDLVVSAAWAKHKAVAAHTTRIILKIFTMPVFLHYTKLIII